MQTTATSTVIADNAPVLETEESIPALPAPEQSSTLKTVGYSSAIGFSLGFMIGAVLVGTGIFAPVGTGILGVLTLGLTIATITGALSGTVSYNFVQTTPSSVAAHNPAPATSSFAHHAALQQSTEADEQLNNPLSITTSG